MFNWLPGERETTEDDRPTHRFLSLGCPCLLFRQPGCRFNLRLSQVMLKKKGKREREKKNPAQYFRAGPKHDDDDSD